MDFNYDDTSGEVRDQRAAHEVRLGVFMNALEDDLAASGKFRVIVPACRPDPCSRSSGSELLKAAYAAGADFLLVGGIHKMSTHCAVGEGRIARPQERPERARQTFTFRGDTDQAWRRAEQFISNDSLRLLPPMKLTGPENTHLGSKISRRAALTAWLGM